MSSFTNFLNLFKWDSKKDAEEEFNIDKALNENWDKIDVKLETYVEETDKKIDDFKVEVNTTVVDFETETNIKIQDLTDMVNSGVGDLVADYTGTNITAQTKVGCARINFVKGFTKEEGTGEKSLNNIHTIKCLADDVNLYDKDTNLLKNGLWDAGTRTIKTNSQGWYVVVPILGGQAYTVSKKYTKENESLITFCLATTAQEPSNNVAIVDSWRTQATSKEMTINTSKNARYLFVGLAAAPTLTDDQKRKAVEELKIQTGSVVTSYSQYGYGTVEIISKNGEQQISKVIEAKPLTEGSYVDFKNKKVVRRYEKLVFTGSDTWSMLTETAYGNRRYFFTNDARVVSISKRNSFPISNMALTPTSLSDLNDKTKDYVNIASNGLLVIWTEKFTTLEQFKAFLNTNNLEVIVERSSVAEEDIDCSDKIQQFDTKTTFYNRDNAEIEVSVTNNIAVAEIYENIDRVEQNDTEQNNKMAILETQIASIKKAQNVNSTVVNLNELGFTEIKMMYASNFVNAPSADWWQVIHMPTMSNFATQIALAINSNVRKMRICQNGTWSSWS